MQRGNKRAKEDKMEERRKNQCTRIVNLESMYYCVLGTET